MCLVLLINRYYVHITIKQKQSVTTYNKPETLMYCVILHGLGTVELLYKGHLYSGQLISAQSSLCISVQITISTQRVLYTLMGVIPQQSYKLQHPDFLS